MDSSQTGTATGTGNRRGQVGSTHSDQVIAAMQRWSEEFIERPHWVVGDLPICPFAKAARLKKTVHFEVLPFDVADPLESNGAILTLVGELPRHQERNTCL